MSRVKPGREIEIKLRVGDISALRNRLKQPGARKVCPRTYESNTLYDTRRMDLTRRGRLIRIRMEQLVSKGKRSRASRDSTAILTYKGPAQVSSGKRTGIRGSNSRFKIREEVEVILNSSEQMTRILQEMGLHPVFRYEKFRTTYLLPGIRQVKVEFDETPAGLFLELEGAVSAIDRAARGLGYSRADYITETYGTLHISDCRRRGIVPRDMLFPPTKILRKHTLSP